MDNKNHLTVKHFALYLGCDVKITGEKYVNGGYTGKVIGTMEGYDNTSAKIFVQHPSGSDGWEDIEKCKLILRPMSSMTSDERANAFDPIHYAVMRSHSDFLFAGNCAKFTEWAISKRFDVFDLLGQGLAIEDKSKTT